MYSTNESARAARYVKEVRYTRDPSAQIRLRSMTVRNTAGAQRARLQRTLLAAAGGLVLSFVVWLLYMRGATWLSGKEWSALMAAFWTVNLAFILAIVSNLNLRLQEPSMTLPQMMWATLSTFGLSYFVGEGRSLMLMIYLLAMTFGAFRLNLTQHLLVAVTALASYAVVIACNVQRHLGAVDVSAQVLDWVVFCVVLIGVSVVGGQANRLRTELVRGNRKLRQARDEAAIAFEVKSRFLASTSHQLHTPLNVMLGATDIVDSAVLESDQRDALSRARYASMHLLSLVNTMIDLSRIESGVLELHVQAMNLCNELDALQAMMRPDTSQRGVELTLERTTLSPTPVMGDATRLQEVLLHLVKYSIDHARANEVHLHVRQSPHGETVHFCISSLSPANNTHGADACAASVTDPAQDSFSLDLCEKLIALMGGTLLTANDAKGSIRFEFALRMPQTPTSVPLTAAATAKTAKRRKMLIVDDSIDNRMLLQVYLKEQPWDLRFAEDGLIAVNEAQQECFDLILMDIRMPRINGHDATRKIREIELEQPARMRAKILAITADDSVNDRQRSIEAGCDDHLVKPLSKTKLMQVLANI